MKGKEVSGKLITNPLHINTEQVQYTAKAVIDHWPKLNLLIYPKHILYTLVTCIARIFVT